MKADAEDAAEEEKVNKADAEDHEAKAVRKVLDAAEKAKAKAKVRHGEMTYLTPI